MKLQDEVFTPIERWHKQYQQMKVRKHCRLTVLQQQAQRPTELAACSPAALRCAALLHITVTNRWQHMPWGRACKPGAA